MKKVAIRGNEYLVPETSFNEVKDDKYYPMVTREHLSELFRELGFLKRLNVFSDTFINIGDEHGCFVPHNLSEHFKNICIPINHLSFSEKLNLIDIKEIPIDAKPIVRIEPDTDLNIIGVFSVIILSDFLKKKEMLRIENYVSYPWFSHLILVNKDVHEKFLQEFSYYIDKEGTFKYDNLVNMLFMVKNAGEGFEEILKRNLPYMDRYTILDTGSSDETLEIINRVLKGVEGNVYQEPFTNFRDSRNRLIELAGNVCEYNVMLDDTYVIEGNLKEFLHLSRSDDVADSFSIFIKDIDMVYSSNRILKPYKKLKYLYKVHEIIQQEGNKNNLCIPFEISHIEDNHSEYMKNRSDNRKEQDLKILTEEIKDNPEDPRNYYYMAETYLCIKDWKNAFYYYKLRSEKQGYPEEIQDSLYKMGVIAQSFLNFDKDICEKLFVDCYNYDKTKPESYFVLGNFYLDNNEREKGYKLLKEAFYMPKPLKTMNNRVQIYEKHIPLCLIPLCLEFDDYKTGLDCSMKLGKDFGTWYTVYQLLLQKEKINKLHHESDIKKNNQLIYFVIDGGWEPWNGKTLKEKGIGGSETFVIKYAEYLAKYGYTVHVFCNTKDYSKCSNVLYIPIQYYVETIQNTKPKYSIINRYTEIVPVTVKSDVDTYLVLHDLFRENEILYSHPNLKKIFCLTEWHKQYVINMVSSNKYLVDICDTVSYGVDLQMYNNENITNVELNLYDNSPKITTDDDFPFFTFPNKQPYSFIYSSFPNRGLLYLLRLFPRITKLYPKARLNIFCNTKSNFVQNIAKDEMTEIERLIEEQKEFVTNHGWVKEEELCYYWKISQVWLYPCNFLETCCRTAMEASASKTLVITNDLGALRDTVGDRGIIIHGDVKEKGWELLALNKIVNIFEGKEEYNEYINRNYEWIKTKTYDKVVTDFRQRFIDI